MALGCAGLIQASGSKVKLMSTGGGSAAGNAAVAKGKFDGSVFTCPALLGCPMFRYCLRGNRPEGAESPGHQI